MRPGTARSCDAGPSGVADASSRFYTLDMSTAADIESRFQVPSAQVGKRRSETLATTLIGRVARVHDVSGDDAVSLRLLEMGLTPGVVVRVVAQAPLGDPLEVEVRGYRLSIRRAEAARIAVTPD